MAMVIKFSDVAIYIHSKNFNDKTSNFKIIVLINSLAL